MFQSQHFPVLGRARKIAHTLVSEYYSIAPREWGRFPYEVATKRALEPGEITGAVLAQVLCYELSEGSSIAGRPIQHYKICLHDDRILRRVRRERSAVDLSSLCLYVLTHELVHIVRFGSELQRADLPPELRPEEERVVDTATRRILRRLHSPSLDWLLNRYDH